MDDEILAGDIMYFVQMMDIGRAYSVDFVTGSSLNTRANERSNSKR